MLAANQIDKLTGELGRIVLAKIERDKLVVPSMPESAERCLDTLRKPGHDAKRIIGYLEGDPVLAALILREASAAVQGAPTKVLETAVARLGTEKLKGVVTGYAAHALFESSDRDIRAANKRIWEHSIATALLARDLAAFASSSDGDLCYLAGLLHDVGKPVLASMMLETERRFANDGKWIDSARWLAVIAECHRPIGVAVATKWKLPPAITDAIRDCADYNAGDRACAANIVRLANAIAKREGLAAGATADDDVDAMIMIGRSMLGLDEEVITRLVVNLKPRVRQVTG